ncbi:hypothetical protein BVRB_6g149640 [Beta vulgaris subsp. vulgaris]|nr:hypothetical protein BVRB_6g149640 [Beta vulgaris subsp. vulgaris]
MKGVRESVNPISIFLLNPLMNQQSAVEQNEATRTTSISYN